MLADRVWKTIEGQEVKDFVSAFREAIGDGREKEVHIGSDSQASKNSTEFVTVVVIRTRSKGGRVFYSRERTPRVKSLRERLMKEVMTSVMVGLALNDFIPSGTELTVHIDANPSAKFKSSSYVKELTAMVVGQGFKSLLKPQAWAASHTADHIVKHKVLCV
jgi:predicted RNase H-related nuclease YkuK (DUF458 family)